MLAVSCVLLLLVSVTLSEEPRKCCFDREFTALLGEVGARTMNGQSQRILGNVQLAYDYYRGRQGAISTMMNLDGSSHTVYSLQDYVNRVTYSKEENQSCIATHMKPEEQMFPPCIPDNATFQGTSTFGYGPEAIDVDSWEFMLPMSNIRVKMAVTKHCVPIAEALFGNMGGYDTEITLFFSSYNPGIDDLSVLDLPTNCTFVNTDHTTQSQVGRRSIRLF